MGVQRSGAAGDECASRRGEVKAFTTELLRRGLRRGTIRKLRFQEGIPVKRWLIVILCLAFSPAFAEQPGDPATKADVQKLTELIVARKQFDAVVGVVTRQLPSITESIVKKQLPNATPEEAARMKEFASNWTEKMFQHMPYDELMEAIMPAYQHHFTHGEVQELIRFYSSPVGKKLVAETPAVMAEYMESIRPVLQKWTESQLAELQASAAEYAKTLRKEKTPAEAPKAKPAS
jgi:hypothetical protein